MLKSCCFFSEFCLSSVIALVYLVIAVKSSLHLHRQKQLASLTPEEL